MENLNHFTALKENLKILLKIRNQLFNKLHKKGGFYDEFTKNELKDESKFKKSMMLLAFGVEGIIIPIGLFTDIAEELAKNGYTPIKKSMISDEHMKQFTIDYLRIGIDDELQKLKDLFEVAYKPLTDTLLKPEKETLQPYATRDFLDLQVWRLAALVDMDDLFFMANPLDEGLKRQKQPLHDAFMENLVVVLNKLKQLSRFKLPDQINFRGWYGDIEIMKKIDDACNDDLEKRDLKRNFKLDNVEEFVKKILNSHSIVETTIETTRAVTVFTAIAQEVYKKSKMSLAADEISQGETETAEFFEMLESAIFRNENFGKFILNTFDQLTSQRLQEHQFDTFIHLIGIIAFCFTRGYFSDIEGRNIRNEANEKERDSFKDNLRTERFSSRSEVINSLLTHVSSIAAEFNNKNSFIYEETRFVATSDWNVLSKLIEKDSLGPQEKEELGDQHTYRYIAGLPLIVKALAQISFEERFFQMSRVPQSKWENIQWPDWLEKLEKQNTELTGYMIDYQIMTNEDKSEAYGIWKDGEDISITASVVDALSLWCGSLMCRSALNDEFGKPTTTTTPVLPQDEDQEIVWRYLNLLKRYTGHQAERREHVTRDSDEWIDVFFTVVKDLFSFTDSDDKWLTSDKNDNVFELSFHEIIKIVALIRHIQRLCPEDERDEIIPKLMPEIRGLVREGGKSTFPKIFQEILKKVKSRFGKDFCKKAFNETKDSNK